MNDPQSYLLQQLRMIEASQLQRSALMNEEVVRPRELVQGSLLALQSRQAFPDIGSTSRATAERYLLLQRLIEKQRLKQSGYLPLVSFEELKYATPANNNQMPRYGPTLPAEGDLDHVLPRTSQFPEFNNITQAHRAQLGQQLSFAGPNISNASQLASSSSEKASFPLPKVKAVPVKKLQLLSFRKAWSDLGHCPHIRKELFSRRLHQKRHDIQGKTRSVIRKSLQTSQL
jgi:hypothetical protein